MTHFTTNEDDGIALKFNNINVFMKCRVEICKPAEITL